MAEAKSPAKTSAKVPERSAARSAVVPATPVPEPVPTADLSKIIEELQKRLSQVEKRSTTASPRRRKATTDEAEHVPAATPIPEPTMSNPAAVEARLAQLRDLEHAMHLEEIALYTRAKAAAQEEVLIRQESQTLRLKLRSFRAMTQRLCEQEAQLAQGLAELESQRGQLEQERAAFEEARQKLEAAREKLEADRAALTQRKNLPAEDAPADASRVVPAATAPASPRSSSTRSIALTTLALTMAIALCVTLAWLTITPIYRASATVAGLSVDDAALMHGTTDHSSWLTDAMLQESMNTLEARGRRPFADVNSMRQELTQAMMLLRNDDGSIEIVYDSPHRNEAVFVLEAVLRSVNKSNVTEASASQPIRITRAAAADLDPARDGRISGAIFYFALLAGLVAAVHALRQFGAKAYSLMSFKKGSFAR